MTTTFPACRREGHGPAVSVRRRVRWAPWRTRQTVVCWVCRTPLSAHEALTADERWRDAFASPFAQHLFRELDR